MKKIISFLLVCAYTQLCAQDLKEKISKLKAPSAPASIIIGNQPATISKPKSWQALEAAVYSNYVNQSGSLLVPNDYSIEFSPYWTTKKNSVSIQEFAAPKLTQSLIQNLSFSISSTKNFIIKDSVKTDAIGFGIRTMLWQGTKREVDFLLNGVKALHLKAAETNFIIKRTLDLSGKYSSKSDFVKMLIEQMKKDKKEFINADPTLVNDNSFNRWLAGLKEILLDKLPEGKADYLDDVSDAIDSFTKIDSEAKQLEELIKDRQGFRLEFAAALALNFPTNKTDLSYVPKFSIWLTPSFQPFKNNHWEFLGVLKYTRLNSDFYKNYSIEKNYFDNSFDYGTRIVYKVDKFSFELELLGRQSKTILEKTKDANGVTTVKSKTDSDFQYLINFNYRISDTIILSYNFGSQFKPVINSGNNLISLATINFGIGGPKKIDEK
jgi:hypothetical protein